MMKIKRFLPVLVVMLGLSSAVSHAQVHVDQAKIRLDVTPGEAVSDTLTIHNVSEEEVRLDAYWEDFSYQPPYDGNKKFFPLGTTESSLKGLVSYSPQQFTIPPKSSRDVSYIIKIPEDAKGGYYGVLFFEKYDPGALTATGVKIITRVGTLFFIESINHNRTTDFTDITLEPHTLRGKFKNQGDTISIPNAVYYIMGADGLVVDRGEVGKAYLPPGAEKEMIFDLSDSLGPGEYSAVITFDFESDALLVKEVDFKISSNGDYHLLKIRD